MALSAMFGRKKVGGRPVQDDLVLRNESLSPKSPVSGDVLGGTRVIAQRSEVLSPFGPPRTQSTDIHYAAAASAQDWTAVWREQAGRYAYKNVMSGEMSWTLPDTAQANSGSGYRGISGVWARKIDLLKDYMIPQPDNAHKASIDPSLFGNEEIEWAITKDNQAVYDSIFKAWDTTHQGFIDVVAAMTIFGQSGLEQRDLKAAYDLADRTNRSSLKRDEFGVAMHLIYRKMNGYPLPAVLPPQLFSAIASTDASATVSSPFVESILPPPRTELPTDGDWSGRGQHVEYSRSEQIPLTVGEHLGRGASADVNKVTTVGGVVLARKLIYCARAVKIEDVKRELEILRKVNHRHVVKLVGSYTQGRHLGLLLSPAAVCDLGTFLDEVDEQERSGEQETNQHLRELLVQLGIKAIIKKGTESFSWDDMSKRAHDRLRHVYGCLANAVEYLHQQSIRHKDIKTRNVLLDKDRGLFLTDFGISRDNTDASTSVTNGIERGTYKYCAPEVATYEPRGRAADVYSLGCVFLEMETVYRRVSVLDFDNLRKENETDSSFQANPEKLIEWMNRLRRVPNSQDKDLGVFDILDLVEKMLSADPEKRPKIDVVKQSLATLCRQCLCSSGGLTEVDTLKIKYKHVKGLYFEKLSMIEKYENLLQRILESDLVDTRLRVHVSDTDSRLRVISNVLESEIPARSVSAPHLADRGPSSPPPSGSYSVLAGRDKPKKWSEAKPVNYDGDDWGDADQNVDVSLPRPPDNAPDRKKDVLSEYSAAKPAYTTPLSPTLLYLQGWSVKWSGDYQSWYFINNATRQSQWDPPEL